MEIFLRIYLLYSFNLTAVGSALFNSTFQLTLQLLHCWLLVPETKICIDFHPLLAVLDILSFQVNTYCFLLNGMFELS